MEKNCIKFQVYLMAIYDKKIKEIDFFYLLPQNYDFARFKVTFILKANWIKSENVIFVLRS